MWGHLLRARLATQGISPSGPALSTTFTAIGAGAALATLMQRRRHGAPPPCVFFLRGLCRYGTACRFSHEPVECSGDALPFHHRQLVQSQVRGCCAPAPLAAAPPAFNCSAGSQSSRVHALGCTQANARLAADSTDGHTAPWRIRVLSYNTLADCLAHEHAAELYKSAPRFALEWGYRSGLIIRWAGC